MHIAYIPGKDGKVVGLSKLNRIVEHFGRRGAIQEQLTVAIHNAINVICEGNIGVMVMIDSTHNCVSCRGVKHQGASMVTSEVSGVFANHSKTAKQEVIYRFHNFSVSRSEYNVFGSNFFIVTHLTLFSSSNVYCL